MTRPAPPGPPSPGGQDPDVRRIAVVRALPGLGDLLCAVPALRALRSGYPSAQITLVGLRSADWFVDRYPELVDDLLVVEGVPGLPEVTPDPEAARRFDAAAQRRWFDLALQLHGSGVVTNPLTTLLGARHQVTARLPGRWRPPGTSIEYPTEGPEVRRLLAVVAAAGCPVDDETIDLPVRADERAEADALVAGPDGDTPPYVCLHPGATRPDNRWPAARFAEAADRLVGGGYRVVLTGTQGERTVVDAVARAMATQPLDLCGRTGVGTLAALFATARLVVSNDTGAAHVAAAVRAPSVVVYPACADRPRWAPLDTERHVGVSPGREAEVLGDRWPTAGAVLATARLLLSAAPGRSLEDAS
jgi:ADP-heptose:LPS heptosyltransferase